VFKEVIIKLRADIIKLPINIRVYALNCHTTSGMYTKITPITTIISYIQLHLNLEVVRMTFLEV
jgi:hypothetical protein